MKNKYTNLKEVTPQEMYCIVGSCPAIYKTTIEGRDVYLAIGKQIAPSEAGLEEKIGPDEVLVEVPRELIDNKGE